VIRVPEQASAGMVEELVAVERSCCPFFELRWEPEERYLAIAVSRREHEPALGAIAQALGLNSRST
jgi:hypothetical protein